MKMRDLKVGDRIAITWYPGQVPVIGTVAYVVVHASRASASSMITEHGQRIRLKCTMKIAKVPVPQSAPGGEQ